MQLGFIKLLSPPNIHKLRRETDVQVRRGRVNMHEENLVLWLPLRHTRFSCILTLPRRET